MLWKTRKEMVLVEGEAGDAINRVGNQLTSFRQFRHAYAVGSGRRAKLRLDECQRFVMNLQTAAEGLRCRLAGIIVRGRTDTTKTKHRNAALPGLAQGFDQSPAIVTGYAIPARRQATCTQARHHMREVPVLAFAIEDLVTDDQHPELRMHIRVLKARCAASVHAGAGSGTPAG